MTGSTDSGHLLVAPSATGWDDQVFGLSVRADFDMPRLASTSFAGGERSCLLHRVSEHDLEHRWDGANALRLFELFGHDDTSVLTVDFDERAGARLWGAERGIFLISPDGTSILCAPADGPPWRWRRFLIGQVLPLAALLHGLEILHASAVSLEDDAIVFAGPSRAGKSSVAAYLLLSGAALLADDVVSIERQNDDVIAHPGTGLIGLRHEEHQRLAPEQLDVLGTRVAQNEKEQLFSVRPESQPRRIASLYVLQQGTSSEHEVGFELLQDPRFLLGSTFNNVLRTPERLVRMLDVYAALSRSVPVFGVRVPVSVDAARLAAAIGRHHRDSRHLR